MPRNLLAVPDFMTPAAPFCWPLSGPPLLMGILNITPDSFSDGGRYAMPADARARIEQLLADGADLIDIGGESTRPGAVPVSEQQELDRVLPAVEAAVALGAVVSIDTSRPAVITAGLRAGAAIINDVRALTVPGALAAVVASEAAICLMHMQGEPGSMQQQPHYADVVAEVEAFLLARADACRVAGIERARICLDPGFGFGKTATHNLRLLTTLPRLTQHGYAVLAGLSRKSLIGQLTGAPIDERLAGSLTLALAAAERGARVLRIHDVRETRQAITIWQAVRAAANNETA